MYCNCYLVHWCFSYWHNCDWIVELPPSNRTIMSIKHKLHSLLSQGIWGIWGIQYITALTYLIAMQLVKQWVRYQQGKETRDTVIDVVANSVTSERSKQLCDKHGWQHINNFKRDNISFYLQIPSPILREYLPYLRNTSKIPLPTTCVPSSIFLE